MPVSSREVAQSVPNRHQKRFPYSHNLADLIVICMEVDKAFAVIQRQAETLTPFAVEIRYPDDFYMPSLEEAKEAYTIAAQIRDFVLIRLEDFPADSE